MPTHGHRPHVHGGRDAAVPVAHYVTFGVGNYVTVDTRPVLRPSLAPTLYRPDADPQVVSDDRVLIALPKPLGRLQPQLFAEGPPFVGQPAPLRIPHAVGIPQGSRGVSPYDTTL